jgi:tetratricopeptide (TPR) repeat protein
MPDPNPPIEMNETNEGELKKFTSTVETFIDEILGAGDFAKAHEIMRQYDGPTVPDLADFIKDSFCGVPPYDTARVAAGYRVVLALFEVFTSFPDAPARHWKELGLEIALAALAQLPATPGLEPNIRLLVGIGDLYSKEGDSSSSNVLVRVINSYEQAAKLLTDEVVRELAITIWGVLANLNAALFQSKTAELDEALIRDLSYSLPLDQAFFQQTVNLDEASAALSEKEQELSFYREEAIRCYKRTLALSEELYGRAYTLIDMAHFLVEKAGPGDIDHAAAAYREALSILDPGVDKPLYATTKKDLATLYRKHEEIFGDNSMEKARQGLEEARHALQEGAPEELWEVTHDLSVVYDLLPSGEAVLK